VQRVHVKVWVETVAVRVDAGCECCSIQTDAVWMLVRSRHRVDLGEE
jgi:hypothetical protein